MIAPSPAALVTIAQQGVPLRQHLGTDSSGLAENTANGLLEQILAGRELAHSIGDIA